MKKIHIFCDKCEKEVTYNLLPKYNVDEIFREILRRHVMHVDHLCEPCMESLNRLITKAIDEWKNNKEL